MSKRPYHWHRTPVSAQVALAAQEGVTIHLTEVVLGLAWKCQGKEGGK